jgi:hypothetical protein
MRESRCSEVASKIRWSARGAHPPEERLAARGKEGDDAPDAFLERLGRETRREARADHTAVLSDLDAAAIAEQLG